jgi:CheY-specific phosphatase CheX
MTPCKESVDSCLECMAVSVGEFAQTTLGIEEVEVLPDRPPMDGENRWPGAYIALVGPTDSMQIGIVSDGAGLKTLSGFLLGMEPAESAELGQSEVADAMGEVINILAGMVKAKQAETNPSLNLGLPIFLDGKVEPRPQQVLGFLPIRVAEVHARVVVICNRD